VCARGLLNMRRTVGGEGGGGRAAGVLGLSSSASWASDRSAIARDHRDEDYVIFFVNSKLARADIDPRVCLDASSRMGNREESARGGLATIGPLPQPEEEN